MTTLDQALMFGFFPPLVPIQTFLFEPFEFTIPFLGNHLDEGRTLGVCAIFLHAFFQHLHKVLYALRIHCFQVREAVFQKLEIAVKAPYWVVFQRNLGDLCAILDTLDFIQTIDLVLLQVQFLELGNCAHAHQCLDPVLIEMEFRQIHEPFQILHSRDLVALEVQQG